MTTVEEVLPVEDTSQSGPPDVYMFAFACEPGRGSEPGVGFAFARAAARLARERGYAMTLVTRPHRIRQIEDAIGPDAAHLTILPVRLPMLVVRLTGRRFSRIAYMLWQLRATRIVEGRIRRSDRPTVVHHVSFATEAVPAFEGRLDRLVPKVYGPAGSAAVAGGGFRIRLRRALRRRIAVTNLATADLLLAQNDDVATTWRRYAARIVVEPNIVIEPLAGARPPVEWDAAAAGRLIERKRYHLALEAFASSGATGRLLMIGDGPERASLVATADRLGISDRVDFVGDQSREAVLSMLSRSSVLLHPSRQEGAPWVVGEAQSVGAAPIVFDGSGSDATVRAADLGWIVDPAEPDGFASALRSALAAPRAEISGRWSADRLPGLLHDWYTIAVESRALRGVRRTVS